MLPSWLLVSTMAVQRYKSILKFFCLLYVFFLQLVSMDGDKVKHLTELKAKKYGNDAATCIRFEFSELLFSFLS